MLVMYTMYQGVSQTLPKTAFLMFIDNWLIFCLIVPICVFLIEIAWEFDHTRKLDKEAKKVFKPRSFDIAKRKKSDEIAIPYQRLAQCVVIGATIAFVGVYMSLAVYYYNNEKTYIDPL